MRLIDHLKAGGLSNNVARDWLRSGKVKVDGWPTADGGREVDPATVVVNADAPRVTLGRDVVIVYKDQDVVVVLKPPGLLSVSAPGRRDEGTVTGQVARALGEAFTVHRLDEGTSGLMLVARSEAARDRLKEQFAAHTVERCYLAFVLGAVPAEPWTMRGTLVRDRGDGRRGPGPGGLYAETEFRRVASAGHGACIVQARLKTGRTHQVRIHLAESGFPVLGDTLYGKRGPKVPRLMLHAAVLGFMSPRDGRAHRFEAPLADDLAIWLRDRTGRPDAGGGV